MPSQFRVVLERLKPWYLARLLAMMREMGAAYELMPDGTYRQSAIISAWRSYAHQAQLYSAYRAGKGPLAARPGTSNHEGKPPDGKAQAVDWNWWAIGKARQLAPRYGFHFPIKSESWHMESMPHLIGKDLGYTITGRPPPRRRRRRSVSHSVQGPYELQPTHSHRRRIYVGRATRTPTPIHIRCEWSGWAKDALGGTARLVLHKGDGRELMSRDPRLENIAYGPNTQMANTYDLYYYAGSPVGASILVEIINNGPGVLEYQFDFDATSE